MSKQEQATVVRSDKHSTEYVHGWTAPSRTHLGVTYVVTFDRLTNAWACQCPAYTYRQHCAHIESCMDDLVNQWREAMTGERTTRGAA